MAYVYFHWNPVTTRYTVGAIRCCLHNSQSTLLCSKFWANNLRMAFAECVHVRRTAINWDLFPSPLSLSTIRFCSDCLGMSWSWHKMIRIYWIIIFVRELVAFQSSSSQFDLMTLRCVLSNLFGCFFRHLIPWKWWVTMCKTICSVIHLGDS